MEYTLKIQDSLDGRPRVSILEKEEQAPLRKVFTCLDSDSKQDFVENIDEYLDFARMKEGGVTIEEGGHKYILMSYDPEFFEEDNTDCLGLDNSPTEIEKLELKAKAKYGEDFDPSVRVGKDFTVEDHMKHLEELAKLL